MAVKVPLVLDSTTHLPVELSASDTLRGDPAGYIDGLKMVWNSTTSISVTSGSCYIEGLSTIVSFPSLLTLSSLSLSASTWYHLYAYLNSGTPAIELVTTAPATAYNGTARSKTSDTSRRYIGSVKTDASNHVYNFFTEPNSTIVNYLSSTASAPFLVISNGLATTPTSVVCSGIVPVTARLIIATSRNLDTANSVLLTTSDSGFTLSTSIFTGNIPPSSGTCGFIPADNSQTFLYMYAPAPTGGFVSRVNGYVYER